MKRRISSLTGNVAADGLLTGIANHTTNVPITRNRFVLFRMPAVSISFIVTIWFTQMPGSAYPCDFRPYKKFGFISTRFRWLFAPGSPDLAPVLHKPE